MFNGLIFSPAGPPRKPTTKLRPTTIATKIIKYSTTRRMKETVIISEEDAKETVIISQKRTEKKLTPVTFSASEGKLHVNPLLYFGPFRDVGSISSLRGARHFEGTFFLKKKGIFSKGGKGTSLFIAKS